MARLLSALILAFAGAIASGALADTGTNGSFLVSREGLPDPNFGNSVILLTPTGAGAAGLIVNKPTKIPLSKLFPDIAKLAKVDDKLFFGGPVSLNTISFVFRAKEEPDDSMEIMKGVYLSSSSDLLRELLERDKPTEGLRVFMGYAGWAPGQLEGEISRGDWHRTDADSRAIFEKRPETLWHDMDFKASATQARYLVPH